MRWTIKLIAETRSGESVEQEVATIERADVASPAIVGLTISEGKTILESLQEQIVVAQIEHHGAHIPACPGCRNAFRTKGYYRSILRSVYGNVSYPHPPDQGMFVLRIAGAGASQRFSQIRTQPRPDY